MNLINRKAYLSLMRWKERKNRKPLILRGARQVGKTTLVNMFAKEFASFITINMEKTAERQIFEKNETVSDIINAIYLLKKITLKEGVTLLFIDEIQESPRAIHLLRYFYEERPDLYIIAAGSLLEFSLRDVPGFPVGRVEYLCVHPLDFEEYLMVYAGDKIVKQINEVPVAGFAHDILLRHFHEYVIIGGMPEVVREYLADRNISSLSRVYESIWQSFMDDAVKYAKNETERKVIQHILDSAPKENDRVKFEKFGHSEYRSREIGEGMRALDRAKIIQLIYPTTSLAPPVIADLKKRPRLQLLDTGLLNYIAGLQGEMVGLKDLNDFYRGKIIQHLVAQQIIAIHEEPSFKPHFWVRENKNSSAEVDMVIQHGNYIVPLEVKSGEQGRLRSLHQFVERSNHPYAIRLWAEKFSVGEAKTPDGKKYLLMNLPYYLAVKLPLYMEWFFETQKL